VLYAKLAAMILRPIMPLVLKQYLISGSNPKQLANLKAEVDGFLNDIRMKKLDMD
jgi:hypothetical protein